MKQNINKLIESIKKLSLSDTKKLVDLIEKQNFTSIKLNKKSGIKRWLDLIGIENYTINDDLTVDVNGDVKLSNKYLDKIPVQFGIVKGHFFISNNEIEDLYGSPIECEIFNCDNNELINLEGSPKKCTSFNCANNDIVSLKGHPIECEKFYCLGNPHLTEEYLNDYDFSFVKQELFTDYGYTNLMMQRED